MPSNPGRRSRNQPHPMMQAAGLVLSIREWLAAAAMLLGLPILGIWVAGRPVNAYLQFPPLTRQVVHAPFSWPVFLLYVALDVILILSIITLVITTRPRRLPAKNVTRSEFPIWGWMGLVVLIGGWILAWTRFQWFAPLQGHTFILPWIGYIIIVNALSVKRSGRSLLTHAGQRFVALIIGSAVFWWFFEYLNRFVENWYYVGLEDMGAPAYTLFASLAFATVLPAVLSTQYWLLTFAPMGQGLQTSPWPYRVAGHATGTVLLTAASLGLALIGIWPDLLFALVWFAPLLVITGLQAAAGRTTIFTPLAAGDWRGVVSAATAALICGFFWELWNMGSLARWQYAVPYVNRFHLFAMPILGYGGYLPFGLECMLAGALILGSKQIYLPSLLKEAWK